MRFSLSFLLISMVAVCLVINMWNNFRLAEVQRAKCEEVSSKIGARGYEAAHADQIELIYDRAFEAFQKRKTAFAAGVANFEKVADKYSVLKVTDPSRVHLVDSEVLDSEDGFHERFRIWIPDSPAFNLQLGFHNADSRWGRERDLRSSSFFRPADTLETPLPKGESMVDLIGIRQLDTFRLQLLVNKEVVHEATRTLTEPEHVGNGKRGLSMRDCIDLKPETHMIFSIDSREQDEQKNESIAIQIIALDQSREAP